MEENYEKNGRKRGKIWKKTMKNMQEKEEKYERKLGFFYEKYPNSIWTEWTEKRDGIP